MVENATAGKYFRIVLTEEDQNRCATDPDFISEVLLKASAENGPQPADHCYEAIEVKKDDLVPGNVVKWSEEKIKLLLTLVAGISPHRKENNKQRKVAWEAISKIFKAHGHEESGVTISKKWANLQDRYKKIKMRSSKSSGERVSWPYFGSMDDILGYLPGTSKDSSSSSDNSSSSSSSDSYYERKGRKERKKRKKKMAKHAKKRSKVQEDYSDQVPAHQAPGWFIAYIKERNEEEKKWRTEIANIMRERNEAMKSLAASINEFAKK